jgi:hypothetical protein
MGRRHQYNHVRVTLTPTPPPPKTWTTPTYHLERYTIRRNVKTVNVQLHGLRGNEKRTESMSFPLLPNVTDAELVRAAVFCSPHKWTVHFGMNVKQFNGRFASPLNQQLLSALMGRPQATPQSFYPQTQPPQYPPYAAPTVANIPVSQPHYQPPIPQPGQFQQIASTNTAQPPPIGNKPAIVQWYKTRTPGIKVSLGCGTLIAVLLFFSCISSAIGSSNLASQPTPTPTAGQAAVISSPVATQQLSPTSQPTATPTPKPTARPTQDIKPTPTPRKATPTPCPGINCNPWGYNFSPGRLIYTPPSNFCSYFNCITSFWGADDPGDGYIVQCQDGTFSQSGGERGACSSHGGVLRPLYAH